MVKGRSNWGYEAIRSSIISAAVLSVAAAYVFLAPLYNQPEPPTQQQIEAVDNIILLGGEDPKTLPRSHLAYEAWQMASEDGVPPQIIVSGGQTSFDALSDSTSSIYVPSEFLVNDLDAKDTYGNFVYSFTQLPNYKSESTVVISDINHTWRSQQLADRIFGENADEIMVLGAQYDSQSGIERFVTSVHERAKWHAAGHTLDQFDVPEDSLEAHVDFLNTKHPEYVENAPNSRMKSMRYFQEGANRVLNKVKKLF